VKDGPCIGGFTRRNWESTAEKVDKNDDNAKLFNITQQLVFPAKKGKSESIRFCKHSGPDFGMCELTALIEPFNG